MGDRHVVAGGGAHQQAVRELLVAGLRAEGADVRASRVGPATRPAVGVELLRESVTDLLDALALPSPVVADLVARCLPDDIDDLLAVHDVLVGGDEQTSVVLDLPGLCPTDLVERPARYARAVSAFVPVVARWEVLLGPVGVGALPAPSVQVLEALRDVSTRLGALDELLTDPATGIHLVPRSGPAGAAEHASAVVALALSGRRPTSVHEASAHPCDPVGARHVVGERGPRVTQELAATGPGPAGSTPEGESGPRWRLEVDVPGLHADDLDLVRHDDDLVLSCAGRRRTVTLPSALRRCVVDRAGVRDGVLAVSMSPDPRVWRRAD